MVGVLMCLWGEVSSGSLLSWEFLLLYFHFYSLMYLSFLDISFRFVFCFSSYLFSLHSYKLLLHLLKVTVWFIHSDFEFKTLGVCLRVFIQRFFMVAVCITSYKDHLSRFAGVVSLPIQVKCGSYLYLHAFTLCHLQRNCTEYFFCIHLKSYYTVL